MKIRLHNTASRQDESFKATSDTVRLYTCGPTVYDYLHIGNWAAYIYWDTLVRVLLTNNYKVDRVMNITDVGHLVSDGDEGEDKLEKGARREGKTAWEVARFYTEDFLNGMKKLGMIQPTHLAKATDYIPEQIELIRILKQKGYTYQISDGIYFDTSKFPRYGEFARLNLDKQKAGARVTLNTEKKNPSDFALWKFSPKDKKRDMEWETPTDLLEHKPNTASYNSSADEGKVMGFPGWHIECSAIAMNFLGESLDIHTGGIDHIPVHHTNEIAQSEAATGKPFSRYWLHNNHLKVNNEKISKSLSNGYTLQDIEKAGYSPIDFRLFVLQSHYRSEANFNFEALASAKNRLNHWKDMAALRWQVSNDSKKEKITEEITSATQGIKDALSNDLDTPEALRIIDETISKVEQAPLNDIPKTEFNNFILVIDELLGLQLITATPNIGEKARNLIEKREQARRDKDFTKSDQLRDQLLTEGVAVRDTPGGTVWSYR